MAQILPRAEDQRRWESYLANGRNAAKTGRVLGLSSAAIRTSIGDLKGAMRAAGFDPDEKAPPKRFWTKYLKEDPLLAPLVGSETEAVTVDRDAVKEHRRNEEVLRLRRENKTLAEQIAHSEDLRASVFGLKDPLEPISFQPVTPSASPATETIIVNLSDWQWGEVIEYAAMDGLNSFDRVIAARRVERCFQAILDLATKHWSGPPPERLIVVLGGDMISGDIHLELTRTQTVASLPAVREVAQHVRAGLELLLANLECPIEVISIPGNHGRSTFKPESKWHAETSYDNLVCMMLEDQMRDSPMKFYIPSSGDALFSVYGWRFLVTHGDKMGSRGGQGFIGPVATIARGHKKLMMDYMARGEHVDFIITGHFHTACATEEGFGNGALAGPSEFSRDGRFRVRPATQLFLSVHPRRGVSQYRFINVGSPEEGSLYDRPEPPAEPLRPKLVL